MHFHNFAKNSQYNYFILISTMIVIISLSKFVKASRGFAYIDKEEPYKSFVGKIVSVRDTGGHRSSSSGRSAGNQKSSRWDPLTKGRSAGGDTEKPNWYFADPLKLLGRTIMNYEPSDPNEPDPSAKVKESSHPKSESKPTKESDSPVEVDVDSNKDSGSSPHKDSPDSSKNRGVESSEGKDDSDKEGEKKKAGESVTSDNLKPTGNVRVVEFEGDEVDPDAPGWFALKANNDFGKRIMLGTLLRKRGHGRKNRTAGLEYEAEGLGDAGDGSNNDTSELLSPILRRYDKACLHLEYKDAKAAVVSPKISEAVREKIRTQNQQLATFFLNMAFTTDVTNFGEDPLNKQEPVRAFELLSITKDIFFKFICKDKEYDEVEAESKYDASKDKLLPKLFVDAVYSLFLKLYSITTSTEIKDYLEAEEHLWIKSNLEQCNQTNGIPKKIVWFTDECKEQVVAFDEDNNFACTPFLEFDFNVRKYDPVMDFVWHMITSVHAHCFESFQNNARMWHRYALAMADLFPPAMRLRWSASSEDSKKLYTRLFGPHYEVYFDNMNRCMYGANLRSNVPYLLPRFEGNRKTRFASAKYMTF